MSEAFLTVSQLNQRIKDVLQMRFAETIWLCGEIQGFRPARSGHVYFDLVEKEEEGSKVTAKISAALFANRRFHIQNVLKKNANAFELKNDIEVKFAGRVDFYPPYGTVSFIIEDIDPAYTLGRLAQEKLKIIEELRKKGLLERNKALALPLVPLRIGLVTAENSAAQKDFLSELEKSGLGFQVFYRPTLMQGKAAEEDVVAALDALEQIKDLDVLVITRGGGSKADLSDFDSKRIAERVAAARYPVLSGIGHETDLSVTDLVAHTFAKTPTAIAQFIVGRVEEYRTRLDEAYAELTSLVEEQVASEKQWLKETAYRLQEKTISFLREHRERLLRCNEALKHTPVRRFAHAGESLKTIQTRLDTTLKTRLKQEALRLKSYERTVAALHPANTLKRGFSITRHSSGKAVRHIKDVRPEDAVSTEVVGGRFNSTVNMIKKEK